MAFDMAQLTEDRIAAAAQALGDMGTVREMKGITDAEMEAIYSMGFSFYNTGRYDDAEKVFRFLVLFDHLNARYWTGLGAVFQVKKNYADAITAYGYASFLDLKNPKPQYLAAECFLALGDKTNALSAIAALEQFCSKATELGREYLAKATALKALAETNA
ncbi:MAG: SycD/LcrH family type III secretion system chaperone [Victivallales bacterium]|nr:SycD/LcrH family type III secretion system chaperone [Victivallales bacterium]